MWLCPLPLMYCRGGIKEKGSFGLILLYTEVEEGVRMNMIQILHPLYCGVGGSNGFEPSSTL